MAEAAPNFGTGDVRIISQRAFRAGFFELRRFELNYKLVTGGWSAVAPCECLIHDGTVAVLPYDPYANKVVLIERFRIGALGELAGPWHIELPSGMYSPSALSETEHAFM